MRWYCAQFATDDVSTLALCSSAIVWMAQQKPAQLEWSADQVVQLPNGDLALEGRVQISFGQQTLTTDQATVDKDGTVRMASATLARAR